MNSSEHRYIGDQVKVPDGLGISRSPSEVVQLELAAPGVSTVALTYGELVALGGDFYGIPDEPISSGSSREDQVARFSAAHLTLVRGDRDELSRIRRILDYETSKVRGSDHPAAAFEALGNELDYQWNEATGGAPASQGMIGMGQNPGRYTRLATNNLDHFGADAEIAYRAGHLAACRRAVEDLNAALAMNAHADHFLSDLFASGHVRTPRRVLKEYHWVSPVNPQTIGALLSKAMHDEENVRGLTVTSLADGDRGWTAFGDGQILEEKASAHTQRAVQALQVSVDEVIAARSNPQEPAFEALRRRPYVAGAYPPNAGPSIAPMWVVVGGEPEARRAPGLIPSFGSVDNYDYSKWISGVVVALETLGPKYLAQLPAQLWVWVGS